MTLSKLNRVLEIFWWSVAALMFVLVIVMIFLEGFDKWAFYFLVPVFAVFAALIRRFAAKRLAKSEAEREQNKKA